MRALTRRERRIAALSLLALLAWGAWALVEAMLVDPLHDMAQEAETLRQRQARYAGVIAQGEALSETLERLRHASAGRDGLLPGEDPNGAAAELMRLVLERVEAQATVGPGCEVARRTPIAPSTPAEDDAFRPVKAGLTLECAIEPLARVLKALEAGQPALFIDRLSLRRRSDAPDRGGPGRLEVQLLVRGYMARADAREEGA
ncbi:type II secretion system protein GspM [Halomonas elongata]|uniref:General secretion pathway protein GspM n=1 Tax=Halomonas elongata (strain ATCC 33173 / DSM 2581 / NBRC 15536 / NCIMB 2198 / 1H9) TaxID=768066 RepID=E1V3H7_HALED|nr:type II secretion system protein GspM [Halomonas elongata]WBF16383.1 type II secretion system protein GspM [Halomonas elongata]WPU48823.1 type II secretion system protein GspM [Halomonas elongata DSM 2581]WVI70088.1 type II secretion system protein GspM [Halomonas elongata]CBV42656.1 general secretion pathway protein GspM [Halomonas elongata DSM 2581]